MQRRRKKASPEDLAARKAEKEERKNSPIVKQLSAWLESNKLSQRQAVDVMVRFDLPVSIQNLQCWVQGVTSPGKIAAKALKDFMEQHPEITDAPTYEGRWPLKEYDVPAMKKLHDQGKTYAEIGEMFGLTESGAWRILNGERRAEKS